MRRIIAGRILASALIRQCGAEEPGTPTLSPGVGEGRENSKQILCRPRGLSSLFLLPTVETVGYLLSSR